MKKLILVIFLFSPIFMYAQKQIDTVKISNGRQIIILDNFTWRYISETEINELKKKDTGKLSSESLPLKSATNSTSTTVKPKISTQSSSSYSSTCGARTKSGGYCKRVVKGGGRCWQHR